MRRPIVTGTVGLTGVENAFDVLGDARDSREDPHRSQKLGRCAAAGESVTIPGRRPLHSSGYERKP